MAQSIAEKVEVTVTGEEHQRLSSARPVAPEVYESYLKGRFLLAQGNRAAVEQSIPYFEDALNRDATFAPAYLGLAEAYTILGTVFAGVPPEATRPKVTSFARKALALDPDLVEAHVMLANVLQEEWHWTEAEAEYRRALELNPNNAEAHSWFALWLLCQGRTGRSCGRDRARPGAGPGWDLRWQRSRGFCSSHIGTMTPSASQAAQWPYNRTMQAISYGPGICADRQQ